MTDAARTPPFGPLAAVLLLAGITLALAVSRLLPWSLAVACLLVGGVLWWRGGWQRLGGCVLVGVALASLHAAHALSVQLPVSWEKREVLVEGRIVDLPRMEPRRTVVIFKVDAGATPVHGRLLRLSWYDDYGVDPDPASARFHLRAGERWRLPVRVRAPRGLRNPGGVDAEKHALAQRIAAFGYVHDPSQATRLSAPHGINGWRDAMSRRIALQVRSDTSRFVRALALGDTRGLGDDDWLVLRANGLTHLIAISGFHVGLVAGFFALFARAAWWLRPTLGLRVPRHVAAGYAAVAGAALYAAVAGFALPTVRTVLMIAVIALARGLRRNVSMFDAVALAAILVLILDPLAVLGAGFWLSFLGVAWLLWCLPEREQRPLRALVSAQGVATIGLLPVSVALFGQASLAGPLANLVAVPWWSLVVVPFALAGVAFDALHAGWGAWPWRAAAWCFDRTWPLFEWLASGDLALVWLAEAGASAVAIALIGAFWLLLPRGVPGKPLAALMMLGLLWPDRHTPAQGEVELTVIDVGQGLSVLVRTRTQALLYDMGPAIDDGFDAGERAVLPALRASGVVQLERAVVSHGDNDHAGGWDAVRREMPVLHAIAPPESGVPATQPCVAGQRWRHDGVTFRVLHPPRHFPYLKNESSCVLRIETAHGAVLLTGDIGDVIESRLLAHAPSDLRADVVLVAHHGSGGSSAPDFVAATRATHALVSSGHGNRFRHPRRDVVERWQDAGAHVHDTARDGAIRVRMGAGGIKVQGRRRTHARLWDAQARAQRAAGSPVQSPRPHSHWRFALFTPDQWQRRRAFGSKQGARRSP